MRNLSVFFDSNNHLDRICYLHLLLTIIYIMCEVSTIRKYRPQMQTADMTVTDKSIHVRTVARLLLTGWCLLIFGLSARADYPNVSQWFPRWLPEPSYFVHAFLFGILGFLAYKCFRNESLRIVAAAPGVWAVVFSTLYGVFDELHQRFVPGRSCDWHDLAVDMAAAIMVVVFSVRRWSLKRQKTFDQPPPSGV